MIVVAGTFPIDGSKRDGIVEVVNAMRAATLAEDGCLEYRFSFATDDVNTMLIFEEWRDQEALTAHFTMPHMAIFQGRLVEFLVGRPVVSRYEVSDKGPLR